MPNKEKIKINEGKMKEVLEKDFAPEKIIDRKHQKEKFEASFFNKPKLATNVVVVGDMSGIGKTAFVRHYMDKLDSGWESVFVLCTGKTPFRILKGITRKFTDEKIVRSKGDYLEKLKGIIEENEMNLVIVLDEINELREKSLELLSLLLHLQCDILKKGCVKLICISNESRFKEKYWDSTSTERSVNSRLRESIIHFQAYHIQQTAQILQYYFNYFTDTNLSKKDVYPRILKFAREVGGGAGNIRYLISQMAKILKKNKENNEKLLSFDTGEILADMEYEKWKDRLKFLGNHDRVILLCLQDLLMSFNKFLKSSEMRRKSLSVEMKYLPSTKNWYKRYKKISKNLFKDYDVLSLVHFKRYLRKLEQSGFIEKEIKYFGRGKGRKALYAFNTFIDEFIEHILAEVWGEVKDFFEYNKKQYPTVVKKLEGI